MPRPSLALVLVAGALAGLGGCSAGRTANDYRRAAEDLIEGSAEDLGQEFVSARCQAPSGTDIGTTFRCIAFDPDGRLTQFDAAISAEGEITVTLLEDETEPSTIAPDSPQ